MPGVFVSSFGVCSPLFDAWISFTFATLSLSFDYCGCYTDNYSPTYNGYSAIIEKPHSGTGVNSSSPWFTDPARAMNWSFAFEIYNNVMTVEKCGQVALARGAKFFGLEFGQE